MKRIMVWLIVMAMFLPGMAMSETEQSSAPEVAAPVFICRDFPMEARDLVRLQYNIAPIGGELFILEDGYVSVGYERDDDVICPYPSGKLLKYLNSDLSIRWVLEDERLTGAWYTNLLEFPDALLLGWERSPQDVGQVYSLMMIEKATGVIRWQVEGEKATGEGLLWIGECRADGDGNILVGSNGDLRGNQEGAGTLSLLNAKDGDVLWSKEYQTEYGMIRIEDICPLGDGWVVSGVREKDRIILYTDAQGVAQSYFTLQTWVDGRENALLWLMPVSKDVVYLGGWERDGRKEAEEDLTMYLMRITKETFVANP